MKKFSEFVRSGDTIKKAQFDTTGNSRALDDVKDELNNNLDKLTSDKFISPYVALEKISKLLAYYSVVLPKHTILTGDKGAKAFEISQFGNKAGMTDQGKAVTKEPEHMLYFEYDGSHGGYYTVTARVTNQEGVSKILDAK